MSTRTSRSSAAASTRSCFRKGCADASMKPGSASAWIRPLPKKGRLETLYTAPPAGSVVICLDEMGPVSAKSYAGRALVHTRTRPAERAKQEIDYGRRAKGYVFGAFCPATGEAFTHPYPGRGGAHWVDFLGQVETWIPSTTKRVYAIMDNLSSHRTTDVLLFLLGHPRWEMVFQPKYAAYLNLIE